MVREVEVPRSSQRVSTLEAATCSTVAERRQVDARKLSQQLRGELDWIVMKSLEKDRSRRYETANALARDVERYLQDEPVEATLLPERTASQSLPGADKALLIGSTSVLLTLLVGIVGTNWQSNRAVQALRREQLACKESRCSGLKWSESVMRLRNNVNEQTNENKSHKGISHGLRAVDRYLARVSQDELLRKPGLQELRKDLLELALKYYQEFAAEHESDPALRLELAKAHFSSQRGLWHPRFIREVDCSGSKGSRHL